MTRNKRQEKAKRVIMISSRRMLSKLLDINPKDLRGKKILENQEFCYAVREVYQQQHKQPDRLTRAYDLADLVT